MNIFKVNINRLVSLTVLSALMCVPEMAEAGKTIKIKAAEKKRREDSRPETVPVSPDVSKKNKNVESTNQADNDVIPALAAMLEEADNQKIDKAEADNLAKRGEREEDDEYDPRKVKKERIDDEFLAASVMDNPMVYIGENESNPRDVIDLEDDPDEQPNQNTDQAKKMLPDDKFQALLAWANAGDLKAMIYLSMSYIKYQIAHVSKVESDREAFDWVSKAAAKGNPIAENQLGYMYLNGHVPGVEKNESKRLAFDLYSKAAAKGNNSAESHLGYMYLNDHVPSVEKNESKRLAFDWFSKAAAKGNNSAESHLGSMYLNGQVPGVQKEDGYRLAFDWFSKAAAKGDKAALNALQKLQQAEGPVVASTAVAQVPQVQVDLQDDVVKAIEFNAKAKFNDRALTKIALAKIKRNTQRLEAIATNEMKFSSKSTICTTFEPCLAPFQKMLLERTLPDYKACFKGAYTEPVLLNCIKAKDEDRLVQDASVLLWEDTMTVGTSNVALASRMLSHVKSDQQPDMNAVYKDAQVLHQIACGRPVEFKITLPQDASLRSCCSFVDSTLKTLDAAQATYHVNLGGLVNPDPFLPVIKVFGSLQSAMRTLSQEMETAIKTQAPRRNAALMKDEKFKALRPPAKALTDDEDDE